MWGCLVRVCFDCVLVLSFVAGYVLQFGEIAHNRVHHYRLNVFPSSRLSSSVICGQAPAVPQAESLILHSGAGTNQLTDY